MPDPVTIAILAGISLLLFTVAGLAGFGSGVIALPVLVWMLGPREAVPIITLVQLVGSASRTGLNWKEISWPVLKCRRWVQYQSRLLRVTCSSSRRRRYLLDFWDCCYLCWWPNGTPNGAEAGL